MTERIMAVDRMEQIISVFGSFDRNVNIIETELNVKVTDRESELHITGDEENIMYAEKAIQGLLSLAAKGENIDEQNVRYIIKLVREGAESKIDKIAGDVICITSKGKPVKAKTVGQKDYA
ncbi:MAG: phosphate starvation-inducible protein PhoH, partial [Oscillospiraceae bacterium]